MSTSSESNKVKHTNTVIVGGGIAGLTVAADLAARGQDFVLIEAQNELGGLVKSVDTEGVSLDYGLKSLPVVGHIPDQPLIRLRDSLGLDFLVESFDDPALIYEKQDLSPFVGFGEVKAKGLVEELSYYVEGPRLLVSGGWNKLLTALKQRVPEKQAQLLSAVTKVTMDGHRVKTVEVNGSLIFECERLVWTASPHLLIPLLTDAGVTVKNSQRLARFAPWTALNLDIAHPKLITNEKSVVVLKDTVDEDFFVIGQFVSNVDPLKQFPDKQLSTWMTLLDADTASDDEKVSKAIKTMKKLIKRAFSQVGDAEDWVWERILVVPEGLGTIEHFNPEANGRLPGFENIYLASGKLKSPFRNVGAALHWAEIVRQSLAAPAALC